MGWGQMRRGKITVSALRRADRSSSFWLRTLLWSALVFLIFLFYKWPVQTFFNLFSMIAGLNVLVAILRLIAISQTKPSRPRLREPIEFPKYSVLVPILNEANMVPRLMNRLEKLDYAADKLEILLICEEFDAMTIRAVRMNLRPPFRLIITPKGTPQTKPRALNFALSFSNGDFITVYDAEDKPHPEQLKTALAAFNQNPDWAALQAPLDYYNSEVNWLTRQFSLEYAALFHVWVPFLAKLGAPFPLGGTSNHIRRAALESCGGWDAHNVTEDADLSFRLSARGLKIGFIDCPTEEEAVCNLIDWHKQRSRWMKGFMQTWLVHMHRPLRPLNVYGSLRFLTLQLTLGYTLLCATLFCLSVIAGGLYVGMHYFNGFTLPFSVLHFIALSLSLVVAVLMGIVGVARAGKPHLAIFGILMPLYWILLFWPIVKAFVEIWRHPFHWHKTPHGICVPSKQSEHSFANAPAE
jgi:cellulose synthase/poly-beta-1,6-N-acetylglucosamine synthase-like glycosyltransferase